MTPTIASPEQAYLEGKVGQIVNSQGVVAYYVVASRLLSALERNVPERVKGIRENFVNGVLSTAREVKMLTTGNWEYQIRRKDIRLIANGVGFYKQKPLIYFRAEVNHATLGKWESGRGLRVEDQLLNIQTPPSIQTMPPGITPLTQITPPIASRKSDKKVEKLGIIKREFRKLYNNAASSIYRVDYGASAVEEDFVSDVPAQPRPAKPCTKKRSSEAAAAASSQLHTALLMRQIRWQISFNPALIGYTGGLLPSRASKVIGLDRKFLGDAAIAEQQLRVNSPSNNLMALRQLSGVLSHYYLIEDMARFGLPRGKKRDIVVRIISPVAIGSQIVGAVATFVQTRRAEVSLALAVSQIAYPLLISSTIGCVVYLAPVSAMAAIALQITAIFAVTFAISFLEKNIGERDRKSLALFSLTQGIYVCVTSLLPIFAHYFLVSNHHDRADVVIGTDGVIDQTRVQIYDFMAYIAAPVIMTAVLVGVFSVSLSVVMYLSISLFACGLIYKPIHNTVMERMESVSLRRRSYRQESKLEMAKRIIRNPLSDVRHLQEAMSLISQALEQGGATQDLMAISKELLQRSGSSWAERLVDIFNNLMLKGQFDEVVRIIDEIIGAAPPEEPKPCSFSEIKARAFFRKGEKQKAIQYLEYAAQSLKCSNSSSTLLCGIFQEALVNEPMSNTEKVKKYCSTSVRHGNIESINGLYSVLTHAGDMQVLNILMLEHNYNTFLMFASAFLLTKFPMTRDEGCSILASIMAGESEPAFTSLNSEWVGLLVDLEDRVCGVGQVAVGAEAVVLT